MPEIILSDYFYGDESREFVFFKIPRQLISNPKFKHVSTDAKLLYGMLLDRISLSAKNGRHDDTGRVYIYYFMDEICGDMTCGRDMTMKLLAELDTVCSTAPAIRIRGSDIPMEAVKDRFLQLDSEHIQYVIDAPKETTTKVNNIRAYLLTALYNAPVTIGPYYSAAVSALASSAVYPDEVRESEENGVHRIEKVYYLTRRDGPAAIPTGDFQREGRTYTLLDMLKNDQSEMDSKEHIEVVTVNSSTDDMTEIIQQLESALKVTTADG